MGKAERQSKLERRQKTRLGREAAWAMADLDDRDAQMMADLDYSTSRARIPSLILITGALGVLLHCSPDWKWYVLPSFVAWHLTQRRFSRNLEKYIMSWLILLCVSWYSLTSQNLLLRFVKTLMMGSGVHAMFNWMASVLGLRR